MTPPPGWASEAAVGEWRSGAGTYDLGMTPDEIGARFVQLLAGAASGGTGPAGSDEPQVPAVEHSVSGGGAWARATVDVPADLWHAAVLTARDDADLGLDFFDWLSAVDEVDEGFTVVVHLWSTVHRHGVLIRTRIADRSSPAVRSIVDIYPGAAWHERETHEMFGVDFPGHPEDPGLAPLLLSSEFAGHPLRKEFVLASRVAKPWPGAKEPGEGEHSGARRQPMRPSGVPDPNDWGPTAGMAPPAPAERARPARERPVRERPARAEGAAPRERRAPADRPARAAGREPSAGEE